MSAPLPNLDAILGLACDAARAAGRALAFAQDARSFTHHARFAHDVKLSADLEAEAIICEMIRSHRPNDGILAEERGAARLNATGVWIIDPLDGTVNFSHGHPHFAVSIAFTWQRVTHAGVIYDCRRDQLYTAIRGAGAFCNGRPIHAAHTARLADAMLAIGLAKHDPAAAAQHALSRLAPAVQKLRISGAAALDLAFTACGRLDAYLENPIYLWDIAAGALITEEAGAACYTWPTGSPAQRICLAAAPGIAPALLELLNLDPSACARTCFDDHDC